MGEAEPTAKFAFFGEVPSGNGETSDLAADDVAEGKTNDVAQKISKGQDEGVGIAGDGADVEPAVGVFTNSPVVKKVVVERVSGGEKRKVLDDGPWNESKASWDGQKTPIVSEGEGHANPPFRWGR